MNDLKAIVIKHRSGNRQYLSALQFFCYGEKVIARYEDHPALAFPLSLQQCDELIPMLRCEFPCFGASDVIDEVSIPGVQFTVVDFPSLDQKVGNEFE